MEALRVTLAFVLWQIKTTLAHGRGRAALLRRLLAVADQQVSPTGLAALPDWHLRQC